MTTVEHELHRAWQIHQQKQYQQAEQIYRKVLQSAPENANGWCYLGIVLHDQRQYQGAVDAYERALHLQAEFPIALNNLGNSLRYTGDYERADSCFQKAIDLKPDYLNAYKNRGTLHVWTGGIDKGLHYYEQALKINPNEAELHRNLGVIYLLQGRFEEGWPEYRWRWRVGDLHRPFGNIPVWEGQDLAGKSIVLTAEQGLGDTINFARMACTLRESGANTTIYCQPPLVALLQAAPDMGNVYPNSLALQTPMHFQCSLLDTADVIGLNETSIPAPNAYLQPSENLSAYWRSVIKQNDKQVLRIGISWQGNPDHQADAFRSFPLSQFEVLSELPGVELISLQAGFGSEQISNWQGAKPLRTLGDNVDKSSGAFMDTAAIMRCLDLVITSDTAIAHVAGALGVPTWIALGFVPDWRWLLDRQDSPWYPSVKLFRQPKIGDWDSVFQAIRRQLAELIEGKSSN